MKNLLAAVLLVFGLGLAVVIGSRLPVSAITVIVGVGCGVLASIPTSILIITVTNRRESQPSRSFPATQTYPPVVVVNSPPNHLPGNQGWPVPQPSWNMSTPAPRQFHLIGQENDTAESNYYPNF